MNGQCIFAFYQLVFIYSKTPNGVGHLLTGRGPEQDVPGATGFFYPSHAQRRKAQHGGLSYRRGLMRYCTDVGSGAVPPSPAGFTAHQSGPVVAFYNRLLCRQAREDISNQLRQRLIVQFMQDRAPGAAAQICRQRRVSHRVVVGRRSNPAAANAASIAPRAGRRPLSNAASCGNRSKNQQRR